MQDRLHPDARLEPGAPGRGTATKFREGIRMSAFTSETWSVQHLPVRVECKAPLGICDTMFLFTRETRIGVRGKTLSAGRSADVIKTFAVTRVFDCVRTTIM
jgi:hypothetical protein